MYLLRHTPDSEILSPSRTRRSPTVPPDPQPMNSAQTAALIVFGVLLGLIITGIIMWCCCCRGPGWRRRSSSRSKVKIIRMSGPRGEKGERGSPGPMGMQGVPGLPGPPVFLPLPAPAAPIPTRPLGPRGMLPGALAGLNACPGEAANESSRDSSVDRHNQPPFLHQHQHRPPQLNTQPNIPPTRYALPSLLQSFAQPQTPIPPPVPIPTATNPPQAQPPQSQPQTRPPPPPQPQPVHVPPPLVYYTRHHYPQDSHRVPIAKLINDHAAGVTRPLPLALPVGRHGMVNLALKYQVYSEKGSETGPRGTERGYQSAYCESSAESDGGYDAGYESMENFGTGDDGRNYGSGRGPRWG